MKQTIFTIVALMLLLTLAPLPGLARRNDEAARRRSDSLKAEYIFMEAAALQNAGHNDSYYMLMRHARALDPANMTVRGELARYNVLMPTVDSTDTEAAYADFQAYFRHNPLATGNAEFLADIARRMGRPDDFVGVWRMVDSASRGRVDPALNLADALVYRSRVTGDSADIHEALAILSHLQTMRPGDIQLVHKQLVIKNMSSDTAGMVQLLQELRRQAPANADAQIFIGSVFAELGMTDSALAAIDRAGAIAPDNGRVSLARAELLRYAGDSAAYDAEVFRALESPSLEFDQKFELIGRYVTNLYGDPGYRGRIDSLFRKLIEVNPGEYGVHDFYATYYLEIDSFARAAEQYEYAVELDPTQQSSWHGLLQSRSMSGDTLGIISAARRTLALFPDDAYAALMGGSALSMAGRPGQAVAFIDSLDMENVDNPRGLSYLLTTRSDILASMGQVDSALAGYNRAIELDAENNLALNNAAYFMAENDSDLSRAEVYASIACAAESENPTYIDTYAWVAFKRKQYPRAKELIDRALELYENDAADNNAPDTEGEESTTADEPVRPAETDETGESEIPAEILDHAGDIYFMNGEHLKAVEFWERALAKEPDNAKIRRKVENRTYFFD